MTDITMTPETLQKNTSHYLYQKPTPLGELWCSEPNSNGMSFDQNSIKNKHCFKLALKKAIINKELTIDTNIWHCFHCLQLWQGVAESSCGISILS